MRILVEPSHYRLKNAGDIAMLRVALFRLSTLWPAAEIRVFSGVPERFPSWAPNVVPMGVQGRAAWLREPVLTDWLPRRLPPAVQGAAWRLEKRIRHSRPELTRSLLVRRFQRRGENASCVVVFFEAVEQADLVVTTGMGGVSDAFPEYAHELLDCFVSRSSRVQ